MAEDIRVATVGAGYFARFHHDAWSRMPGVRLVAVCDQDRERAESFRKEFGAGAAYTDAADMIAAEKPDLLDIAAPPAAHRDLVALAASEKIDAICQKAFTRSLAEAQDTVALAEAAGITLAVHENFRFQPWFREIRRLIDEGLIGDVFSASFRLRPGDGQGPRAYLDRQPYFQTMERFLIHETGIHFIDTFRFLFGEYVSAYADLRRLNPAIVGEDAGIMLLQHAGGVRSLFDGNRLADHIAENRRLTMGELWIDGARGTLRLDGEGNLFHRAFGTNDEHRHAFDWSSQGFGGDCVYALQKHVISHLRDGGRLENSGRAYLANLEVEDAVYRSSAGDRRISL